MLYCGAIQEGMCALAGCTVDMYYSSWQWLCCCVRATVQLHCRDIGEHHRFVIGETLWRRLIVSA